MIGADVEGLFPGAPVIVVSALNDASAIAALTANEAAQVQRAVVKRQREFATARVLAREALARLGEPPCEILNDSERAPIWPAGITGSITHCDTRAVVALAREEVGTVGIDVEHRDELKRDLWRSVFLPSEINRLDARWEPPMRGRMALLLFSAKEALYKAQHPWTGQFMGFQDLEVELEEHGFACTFQRDVGRFARGTTLRGRHRINAFETGELITAIGIPP